MSKVIQGRVVTPPTEKSVLFSKPTPKFVFMHHPNMWDLCKTADGKHELLPKLIQFQLVPGLNGIRSRRGGGYDTAMAKTIQQENGWVFIDSDTAGDGGYLREFDGYKGKIYKDKWSYPRQIGGGSRARVIWEYDLDGYNAWRRSLVEKGTIEKADPSTIDLKIELIQKRIERKSKFSHIPDVNVELDKYNIELSALI